MKKTLFPLLVLAVALIGCSTTGSTKALVDRQDNYNTGTKAGYLIAVANWRQEPVEIRFAGQMTTVKPKKHITFFIPDDDRIREMIIFYADPDEGAKNISLCREMFTPQDINLPSGKSLTASYAVNIKPEPKRTLLE